MKTSHSWSVSRQGVAHCVFRHPWSTILEFLEHKGISTSDVYGETIESLRRSIKKKWQDLLTEGVFLVHDNTLNTCQSSPPYSPSISLCDLHVFGPLKKHLKGQRFNSDYALKNALKE